MSRKDYTDVMNVTMAELRVALVNTEKEFNEAVKVVDLKRAVDLAKRYIELNKLLSKRSDYASKYGINVGADMRQRGRKDSVQHGIAEEVKDIMNENNTRGRKN